MPPARIKAAADAWPIPAIIGGVVGYFVGGRRTFDFGRAR